jgi:amino acid permease
MVLLVTLKVKGVLTNFSASGRAWVWPLLCCNLLGRLTNVLTVHALFSLMGIELVGVAVGEVANR